jgi:hypothetical protein
MKKKVIFSLFVAMLLSFSMMAKSNHTTVKVSSDVNKKHHKAPQKTINTNVTCLVVDLSCMRALACGSTGGALVRDAIRLEAALCG